MTLVKYFEIMKDVVEANISSLMRQTGRPRQEICEDIRGYLQSNSKEWTSGRTPVIHYQNPLCRIAYLFGIVPANANLVEEVFDNDRELEEYFDAVLDETGDISICAFGGGPGTELLGLAKWIEKKEFDDSVSLDFLLIDKVYEWVDSWNALRNQINIRFRNRYGKGRYGWPVITSGNFSPIDINNTSNFGNLGAVFDQDIFIMCYLISDIFANFNNLRAFASMMAEQAPEGSKYLFIDRRGPVWEDEVKLIASEAGLTLSKFNYTKTNMSGDEQIADLGSLNDDINWSPRVQWDAFWVVGTKN